MWMQQEMENGHQHIDVRRANHVDDNTSALFCTCFGVVRGRFSASPATGLVGLQENEFLGDFFECLGFLSLASEGSVKFRRRVVVKSSSC